MSVDDHGRKLDTKSCIGCSPAKFEIIRKVIHQRLQSANCCERRAAERQC